MALFRLQENMPDVYPRKSRDFQLLCNSFDVIQNGVKNDIDSIVNVVDTRLCSERVLPLLQTKLGFFTDKHLTSSELRTVLQAFKYIVRDKGSRTGIQEAIEVFLKVANASNRSRVNIIDCFESIDGRQSYEYIPNTYIVEVAIEGEQVDTTVLTELLKYVLPAGYQLKYSFYQATSSVDTVSNSDKLTVFTIKDEDNNGIRPTTLETDEKHYPYELIFKFKPDECYFTKENGQYKLLESKPGNWPNSTYYKSRNYFRLLEQGIERTVVPEYEPDRYYIKDGDYSLITDETSPEAWSPDGNYGTVYEKMSDGSYFEINLSYNYGVTDAWVKVTDDGSLERIIKNNTLVEGKDFNVGEYYVRNENAKILKVDNTYRSVHGVGTTTTVPFKKNVEYTDTISESYINPILSPEDN